MVNGSGKWLGHVKDPRYNSQRWLKLRKSILAGNPRCDLCGHFGGVNSLDHTIPVEQLPGELFFARENLRPMHSWRSPCGVCSAASGGKIKGACNELKAANPMEVAQQRLFRRTGLQWGEVGAGNTPLGTVQNAKSQTTNTPTSWPYPTPQDAADDLAPLGKGTSDYRLIASMIDSGMPCRNDCDCEGGSVQVTPGSENLRCWDAMWDLQNLWTTRQ